MRVSPNGNDEVTEVASLPVGIYLVRAVAANGTAYSTKLMKK